METLYKKITKGHYPKIPDEFSLDLSTLLRSLLQLDPNKRPSCCIFILNKRENSQYGNRTEKGKKICRRDK